ncbi:MAG: hypothetical protein VW082_11030 [Candidatus Nanopelagicales bacterium]
MDANEMRAISQLVADLNAEIHNEVRMLHDRVTNLHAQVAAWEQWGEQVNEGIGEIATRLGALQKYVVETVTTNAYQSEVTEHYRQFVIEEAVRIDVQLKDLQRGLKRKEREKVVASMVMPVDVDGDDEAGE